MSRPFRLDEGQWRMFRVQCTHFTENVASHGHLALREISVLRAHVRKCRGLEDVLGIAETRSYLTVDCRIPLGA